MKKRVLLSIFALFFLIIQISYAHSERTDSNGGHNCSAKSISKGLCSGYHYHNGGGPTSSTSNSSTSTPTVDYEAIAKQDQAEGEKEGYTAG